MMLTFGRHAPPLLRYTSPPGLERRMAAGGDASSGPCSSRRTPYPQIKGACRHPELPSATRRCCAPVEDRGLIRRRNRAAVVPRHSPGCVGELEANPKARCRPWPQRPMLPSLRTSCRSTATRGRSMPWSIASSGPTSTGVGTSARSREGSLAVRTGGGFPQGELVVLRTSVRHAAGGSPCGSTRT